MTPLHATAAHWPRAGGCALLLGPSGAGKSDLALRLLDRGWLLVADDRVALDVVDGRLRATCPPAIAGLLEARGLGPVPVPHIRASVVLLAVTLAPPERLPEPAIWPHPPGAGTAAPIPHIRLDPWPASAPLTLELAMAHRNRDG